MHNDLFSLEYETQISSLAILTNLQHYCDNTPWGNYRQLLKVN